MSYRRDNCASRASLFDNLDGIEEGDLRASSSYSRDIDEQENDKSLSTLQDRVVFLKRLTGDIHEEVQSHNRMLDRMVHNSHSRIASTYIISVYIITYILLHWLPMVIKHGNGMDSARGIMSGTMDRFKMVFEKKSSRRTCKLVAYFVLSFIIIYYLFSVVEGSFKNVRQAILRRFKNKINRITSLCICPALLVYQVCSSPSIWNSINPED